jgi:hypothetical protein
LRAPRAPDKIASPRGGAIKAQGQARRSAPARGGNGSIRSWHVTLFWAALVSIGALLGIVQLARIAELDAQGVSKIALKPLTWDFTNLWYGGRLALAGQVERLFDVEGYRAGLRAMFGGHIDDSEWSYPPTILLIGAPLGLLPLYPSYALWTAGTLALLLVVVRRAGLGWPGCAMLALSPGVLANIGFGQNGALTAALLIGALVAAERRPVLAGLCAGVLTMKPQMGLLLPISLAAGRHWRAFAWAALVAGGLFGLSLFCFGLAAWRGFFAVTQPLMRGILEAPWGAGYQANATTIFVSLRAFGLGVPAAYAVQALASLAAAAAAWRLWRQGSTQPLLRATATGLLGLLATPYGFSYDLVILSAAILAIRQAAGARHDLLLAPLWLWPLLVTIVNAELAPVSPLVILTAAILALRVHAAAR